MTTAAPTQTLLLDSALWDLALDVHGNIAVASAPYAIAQDAASECRLFQGEAYYDTTRGVPYWQQVLSLSQPLSLVRSYLVQAALLVPGAITAKAYFTSWTNRALAGQVQITDANGNTVGAGF